LKDRGGEMSRNHTLSPGLTLRWAALALSATPGLLVTCLWISPPALRRLPPEY
jgi:hypothetical protein